MWRASEKKIDFKIFFYSELLNRFREAIRTLEDSIEFASKILHIDTTTVEPLYTVLEFQDLYLREDLVNDGNCRDEILSNAKVIEEGYFVAPPGNIPLEQSESIEKRFESHND